MNFINFCVIDDEELFCRHLAAKAWMAIHVTTSEKELQELMRKQNDEARRKKLIEMLDVIKSRKNKTGETVKKIKVG